MLKSAASQTRVQEYWNSRGALQHDASDHLRGGATTPCSLPWNAAQRALPDSAEHQLWALIRDQDNKITSTCVSQSRLLTFTS